MARLESRPRNRPRWGTFSKGFPPFPSFLRSSLFFGTKVTSRIYDLAVDQGNTRSFSIRRNDSGKAPVKHGLLLFRTRNSPFSFSLLLLSQDVSKKKRWAIHLFPNWSRIFNFPLTSMIASKPPYCGNDSTRYFSGERNTYSALERQTFSNFRMHFRSLFNLYIYISTSAVQICSLHPARFSVWNGDSVK